MLSRGPNRCAKSVFLTFEIAENNIDTDLAEILFVRQRFGPAFRVFVQKAAQVGKS